MRMRAMLGIAAALALMGLAGAALLAETRAEVVRPPAPVDAVDAYVSRLQVGPPQRHAGLTLYPVLAEGVIVPYVGLTLDEAMERGVLGITELKPAEVNRVLLRNRGKEPVFIMGGEMLLGAKQDRIVGDDVIVEPGAELVIPVYCVEHGRWVAKSEGFSSAGALASSEIRQARQRADQGAVWSGVAAEQDRLSAPSETGAMRSVRESESVQLKVRPYAGAFSGLPDELPKARGVVACVGGEIIGADLFSSRAVFRKLWPKLLDSYVLDAVDRPIVGPAPDGVHVKRWLHGVMRAEKTRRPTPGAGVLYELRGGGVIGSALVHEDGVVHMELFRAYVVRPMTHNRLEFRRQRLQEDE